MIKGKRVGTKLGTVHDQREEYVLKWVPYMIRGKRIGTKLGTVHDQREE